ncbi:class I SAM-dependent methyltransferase [Paenibacillus ginsengihumi]|uniref:methyltransferase domain-containing protein n=1 Tax=Paenibacillus ginsengihumi TaxID=431596 RepID=UPI00035E1CD6|nr:class I SAM-dependent methyltransferase [Paenibacillus ginsengihumi]
MPMNFHDKNNRMTYATRIADESWISLIKENIDISGKEAADIGCGGGIYTKALASLGASHVTGIDFSEEMLKGAAENCKALDNVSLLKGSAEHTGLPDDRFDIILERALIHHLKDLNRCFRESARILKRNGTLIIQDRTPEDCLLPGDVNHIRGYFFEKYPALASKEIARRHASDKVRESLESNGFFVSKEVQLQETRRVYHDLDSLCNEIMQRTGRSILHELTDGELRELVLFIKNKLDRSAAPIIEKDSWTLWFAVKV